MKRISTLMLLFVLPFVVSAQKQSTGWLASFNTIKIAKHTSIHNDVQLRSSDEFAHMQTLLLRAGINFHLNKQFILTGGYAYISNRTASGAVTGYLAEHRIWEQLIFNHQFKSVLVSHRARFEQRFIPVAVVDNDELKADKRVFATRFRYFLRNVIPFRKQAPFKKGMFASLQDEIFLNTTGVDKTNNKVFDQNRLLLGIGYRISPAFDIEAAYLNQYVSRRGDAFTNNHVIQLGGYLRL